MTVRVGVLGTGFIARYHAMQLALADEPSEIVAVHDLDRSRAEQFAADQIAANHRVTVHDDVGSLVAACDTVFVCTWTAAHLEAVRAVAGAGLTVFCEKPLSTDLASARDLVEIIERAGVPNMVGLVLRSSPALLALRELVRRPESGAVMSVVFRDDQYLPTQGMYASTWRGDPELAGSGALLEHSIHDVDILEWLLGDTVSVSAHESHVHGLEGIEDSVGALLRFASGATATLTSVWHDVLSRPSQRRIEVFCERALVTLDGDVFGPVRFQSTDEEISLDGPALVDWLRARAVPLISAEQEFVAVRQRNDGETPLRLRPDVHDALRAHELVDALYCSARDGGAAVTVPEGPAEMHLGVAAALVDGVVVPGDVRVDLGPGTVLETGLPAVAGGGLAVPGFIDLQVNGFAGIDLRHADVAEYAVVASALATRGVTGFHPTFHSQSVDDHVRSLGRLGAALADRPEGARVFPAHLEGPFLSPRWNGAHDPAHLIAPSPEVLDRLLDAGPVGLMTVAPELPGGHDLVRELIDDGVTVSIGHSDATAEQVYAAVAAGVRHVTHCWNAHRRLTARDPGPAGAALACDDLTVGLIADLVHVAPEVVVMTLRAAAGRVAATTDAVAGAGTAGAHGSVVARRPDGTIAGGLAGPDDCLRNLVSVGVDFADAVHACGGVQRQLLGLPPVRLRPGDLADVTVLDDDLTVLRTYVGGRQVAAQGA